MKPVPIDTPHPDHLADLADLDRPTRDSAGAQRTWHVLGGAAPADTLLCVHGNPASSPFRPVDSAEVTKGLGNHSLFS